MYTTRFQLGAKLLQLERQVVFEISDAGRIHRQVRDRLFSFEWLSPVVGKETNGWLFRVAFLRSKRELKNSDTFNS
jgi:hypothetical protein